MHTFSTLCLILSLFVLTFSTRALPFMVGKKFARYPFFHRLKLYFPGIIFTLVVLYELKDRPWLDYPYGLPEICSIVSIVLLQKYVKKEVVSIFGGVLVYVLLQILSRRLLVFL